MPQRLNWLDWTALTLALIGAINWGLIGFFNFDLVRAIFGNGSLGTSPISTVSAVIFAVVGLAGLYSIYSLYKVTQMQVRRPAEERERMRRAA